ncbi:phosphonate ABC transporter, permease protein PhnE [Micrococcoides hystricis]|uniref:Phosphonate ABC transporter, permease protein PhnE n=1 Tax=Micrococcoides hystricis TaxID=1572761 RepID=A0ABV6P8X1_9MICC
MKTSTINELEATSTDGSKLRVTLEPPTRTSWRNWPVAALLTALVVAHIVAFQQTEFSLTGLVDGSGGMVRFLSEALPPNLNWEQVLWPGIQASGITLWIGLLGTTLSIPTSGILAVWASRTTSPHPIVYQLSRSILSFFRAVPDIVFALIFVTAVGLGPFAGVLALICHNTGVMGKLWAEAIEDIDPGPSQALSTVGANRNQIVANATIPQVSASMLGLLLYRFDVNVRSSLVLGLVGAGGIGLLINQSIKSFQFDAMLTHILIVLVMVIAVDLFSSAIRKRLAA